MFSAFGADLRVFRNNLNYDVVIINLYKKSICIIDNKSFHWWWDNPYESLNKQL